jgi:hypothetical protein
MQLEPLSQEAFIASYAGDLRKQNRYRQAMESLRRTPVSARDAWIQTFTKAEKVNFTAKRDPAPRIISPRDPRYNLALGVYIKAIEGVLYKILDDMFGGPTVMKGRNMSEVGRCFESAWSAFSDPVAIAGDAKRFDQHTGPEALRYEKRVYQRFFAGIHRHELARLLEWQQRSRCRGYVPEGYVDFMFDIRASGDMNTGLGTCLIACSILYSYTKKVGLTCRVMDNGDDFVVICERRDAWKLEGFHEFCKTLGYFMVMEEPVFELEHIEFCQAHPVWDGEGYRMVRNFPTSIGKDMISLLPLRTASDWAKWANDTGECGVALNSGIPVLQSLYSALRRSGSGSFGDHPWTRYTGARLGSKGMESTLKSVEERSRFSFWLAFGVSPAEQRHIEEYYDARCYDTGSADLQGYSLPFLERPLHHYHQHHFNF